MVAQKTVAIPTFTYGTYRSQSGEEVTFTDEFMRTLEKNTNRVLQAGVFRPPVGYDHPVWGRVTDTDAHGHIAGVRFANGVLSTEVAQPSDKLKKDAREGRRLHVSGEYVTDFSFFDPQTKQKVTVGPTIVGLAALGAQRPALKSPRLLSLGELAFGESVTWADAYATREELRKSGFVAQTLDGTVHAFSEVAIAPDAFGDDDEEETEMDEKQIQTMITNAVSAAIQPLKDENAALRTQLEQISTTGTRAADAKAFSEKLREDGKHFGKLATERLIDILSDATIPAPALTKIKAFAEALSPVLLSSETAGGGKKNRRHDDDDDVVEDEPEAVSLLNGKHFSEMQRGRNEELVSRGVQAFAEWKPDLVRREGKPLPLKDQIAALRKYVEKRDSADDDE